MLTRISAGLTVLVLLGGIQARAQEHFSFTMPADVAVGRDDGFLAKNETLTDTIIVLRPPQFSFTNDSPRTGLSLTYQPEVELFHNNPDLNALNHTGNASFSFRMSERLRFNATDDALVTHDPTRSIPGSLMFLPRLDYKQNMAHVALNYTVNQRNTLSVSFDDVAASPPINTLAFPETGHVRNAVTVAFAHNIKPKELVTATYSLLTGYAQFAGVSYENQLRHDLTVHLSAGVLVDNGQNYLLSGQFEKRLGKVWLSGGYHRFLSIFGTSIQNAVPIGNDLILPAGVSSTNVYQVYTAALAGKLSSRAGIEMGVAATKNNSGIADRDIDNITGRVKLDYGITERLRLYTDVQIYSQKYNVFIGVPIDRRRYVAGLQIDVSAHPNRFSNIPQQTKPTQR